MRTNIYIDGFNLYYAIKHTHYKWLNLSALCHRLLPGHTIQRIYYFTAIVKALPHDPSAPVRQEIYIRALKTLRDVEVRDDGHFVQWPRFYLYTHWPTYIPIYSRGHPNQCRFGNQRKRDQMSIWQPSY